jgi:hypothetical protein
MDQSPDFAVLLSVVIGKWIIWVYAKDFPIIEVVTNILMVSIKRADVTLKAMGG